MEEFRSQCSLYCFSHSNWYKIHQSSKLSDTKFGLRECCNFNVNAFQIKSTGPNNGSLAPSPSPPSCPPPPPAPSFRCMRSSGCHIELRETRTGFGLWALWLVGLFGTRGRATLIQLLPFCSRTCFPLSLPLLLPLTSCPLYRGGGCNWHASHTSASF